MSAELDQILRDPARMQALRSLALLDSAAEPAFERLTRLATKLLQVPTALMTLVDEDRQFFKSCVGLPEPWASRRETPLSHSFCQYAVFTGKPFIVEDARVHPLVEHNLAVPDLGVVAYAGIPLLTSDGLAIGTFCAIDSVPRAWSEEDIATLRDLTSMVMTELELRGEIAERKRNAREREALLSREQEYRRALERSQQRLSLLAEASRVLSSSLDPTEMLTALTDLIHSSFTCVCEAYLLDEADSAHLRIVEGAQPAVPLLSSSWCANLIDPQAKGQLGTGMLSSGTSLFLPRITEADLETMVGQHGDKQRLYALRPKSLIIVPIDTGSDIAGLLIFMATERDQLFTIDDRALAEEIGRRAGQALATSRAYHAALNAIRVRNDVLAVVSHDLRNPLHVMQLYAHVLQGRLQQFDQPDGLMADAIQQINGAGSKMAQLLSEMMDVATLQAGHTLALDRGEVDLVALMHDVVQQRQPILTRHHISMDVMATSLTVSIDQERLERVLANLIDNAIKYSPDGGAIVVTLGYEYVDHQQWAVVRVCDQGIGVPALDLPHIFDQFYRGSNLPEGIRGMGIGLASARYVVEQHGGTISAVSTEDRGTTICIRLPLLKPVTHV